MTELIVDCQNVNVAYTYAEYRYSTLKEYVMQLLSGKADRHYVHALRNVDLQVSPGESVGLIGHNGSGKSTLLKVIAGIIIPEKSRVNVFGRVAPMIELGTGFDRELSGYENIHLSCTLLGLTRHEIRDRIDSIIAFAELEDYIDMPLKNYSSGMEARLGFACATAVDPNLLLVDEVLAVGDQNFAAKCLLRIDQLRNGGCTVILVSHDTRTVKRFCNRAVVLDQGQKMFDGPVEEACNVHNRIMKDRLRKRRGQDTTGEAAPPPSSLHSTVHSTIQGEVPETAISMRVIQGSDEVDSVDFAQALALRFIIEVKNPHCFRPEVSFGIGINRSIDQARVGGVNNLELEKIVPVETLQCCELIEVEFSFAKGIPVLLEGDYDIWLGLHDMSLTRTLFCNRVKTITAKNSLYGTNSDQDIIQLKDYTSEIKILTDDAVGSPSEAVQNRML